MTAQTGIGDGVASPPEVLEIQAEIERAREEITCSVLALRDRVSAATDWRAWVRRRPVPVMAAALGLGLWLGWRRRS